MHVYFLQHAAKICPTWMMSCVQLKKLRYIHLGLVFRREDAWQKTSKCVLGVGVGGDGQNFRTGFQNLCFKTCVPQVKMKLYQQLLMKVSSYNKMAYNPIISYQYFQVPQESGHKFGNFAYLKSGVKKIKLKMLHNEMEKCFF